MKKTGIFFLLSFFFLSGCRNADPKIINLYEVTADETDTGARNDSLPVSVDIDFNRMAPDIAQIIRRGELRIAVPNIDIPSFHEPDPDGSGDLTGFSIDLGKALAESLGVKPVFDRSAESFAQLPDMLIDGKVDLVVSVLSLSTDRVKYIDLSEPYITTYYSLLVGKQHLVRHKIEYNPIDFLKKNRVRIGAVKGTYYSEVRVREMFPHAEIVPVSDFYEGYEGIISGDLFAYLSNELEMLLIFESMPDISLYGSVFTFEDMPDKFCVGVSRETPQLLNFVNTYISTGRIPTYVDIGNAYKARFGDKKGGN